MCNAVHPNRGLKLNSVVVVISSGTGCGAGLANTVAIMNSAMARNNSFMLASFLWIPILNVQNKFSKLIELCVDPTFFLYLNKV